jgi:hypothetical protein
MSTKERIVQLIRLMTQHVLPHQVAASAPYGYVGRKDPHTLIKLQRIHLRACCHSFVFFPPLPEQAQSCLRGTRPFLVFESVYAASVAPHGPSNANCYKQLSHKRFIGNNFHAASALATAIHMPRHRRRLDQAADQRKSR